MFKNIFYKTEYLLSIYTYDDEKKIIKLRKTLSLKPITTNLDRIVYRKKRIWVCVCIVCVCVCNLYAFGFVYANDLKPRFHFKGTFTGARHEESVIASTPCSWILVVCLVWLVSRRRVCLWFFFKSFILSKLVYI